MTSRAYGKEKTNKQKPEISLSNGSPPLFSTPETQESEEFARRVFPEWLLPLRRLMTSKVSSGSTKSCTAATQQPSNTQGPLLIKTGRNTECHQLLGRIGRQNGSAHGLPRWLLTLYWSHTLLHPFSVPVLTLFPTFNYFWSRAMCKGAERPTIPGPLRSSKEKKPLVLHWSLVCTQGQGKRFTQSSQDLKLPPLASCNLRPLLSETVCITDCLVIFSLGLSFLAALAPSTISSKNACWIKEGKKKS